MVVLGLFLVAIGTQLYALWRAEDQRGEQVAIGIGARAGNGLLISTLAFLLLADSFASTVELTMVVAAVAALLAVDFAVLVRRPERVVIGYKA